MTPAATVSGNTRKPSLLTRLQSQPWVNKAVVVLVLLAVWEICVRVSDVNPLVLPAPSLVGKTFGEYLITGKLLAFTWETIKMLLAGMGIGMGIALILTTLASLTRFGKDLLTTLTSMLNPLPAIAVLPLALIWLGIGPKSLLFVITNSVVWAMALNTHMGFETVPLPLRRVGRNLGLDGWRLILDVYLPAALPYIFTGIKIAWSFGWRTIIAAELVFGTNGKGGGLGWMINVERYNLNTAGVFVGLSTIIIIGLLMELLFQQIEKHTIRKWGMTI